MTNTIRHRKPGMITLLAFCFLTGFAYGQGEADAMDEIQNHRKKQEDTFRNREESPLSDADRKKFKGLKYYPVDLKYRLRATFIKNEHPVLFKMKTTTTRLPEYVKYGEVRFAIDSQSYSLEVYQSPEISQRPGYEDYLFIPFTDLTNGDETYDVGRYIGFSVPRTEEVIVDFNMAYNPYCSYSAEYSCPIPPAVNDLQIRIPVGEKKFKEAAH
jgi:uncharacterized protein (DUF1684 family)